MGFTYITVVREYRMPDGSPAAGTVDFTPTVPMVNNETTVAAKQTFTLDGAGDLTALLAATTDTATTPSGVAYLVRERIRDQLERRYYVAVPHDQGPIVDLATLQVLAEAPAVVPPTPIALADITGLPAALAAKARLVNTDGAAGRTIHVGATSPTSPAPGDVWIQPTT